MTDEPTHIATAAAALDDPYAALSQHQHGDGDTPTAGGRLIVSAAEAVVVAWRTRALAAEAEVERLRAAIPKRDVQEGFIRELIDACACSTPGCTNRPMIRLDDRHLCRGCYATHDFGDDA